MNRWFVDALREAGHEPISYSGRAMYGKKCVGVVHDGSAMKIAGDLVSVLFYENSDSESLRELSGILEESREDSMGLKSIVYWPCVEWEDSFDEEDDDVEMMYEDGGRD